MGSDFNMWLLTERSYVMLSNNGVPSIEVVFVLKSRSNQNIKLELGLGI